MTDKAGVNEVMRGFMSRCNCVIIASLVVVCVISCAPPTSVLPRPAGEVTKKQVISSFFENVDIDPLEGIWYFTNHKYEIALMRNTFKTDSTISDYDYVGIIVGVESEYYRKGDVKFLLNRTAEQGLFTGLYFTSIYGYTDKITAVLQDKNLLSINFLKETQNLIRTYPSAETGLIRKTPRDSSFVQVYGTGFAICPSLLVTNYHVVDECRQLQVKFGEQWFDATLLVKDETNDLALLRIEKPDSIDIKPIPIGSVDRTKVGDYVLTIGYPIPTELGCTPRLGEGIINSTVGIHEDPRMFQVSIPLQPGNSGGPLLNGAGEVIGVVTSTINNRYMILERGVFPQNVNFAVKINYLNNLISQLPEDCRPSYSNSGIIIDASQIMDNAGRGVVLVACRK